MVVTAPVAAAAATVHRCRYNIWQCSPCRLFICFTVKTISQVGMSTIDATEVGSLNLRQYSTKRLVRFLSKT